MKRKKVGVEGLQPRSAIDFCRGFFGEAGLDIR